MSLPPLPPRRTVGDSVNRRRRELLEKINRGDDPIHATEDYKNFLIEQGEYFYTLEEVLPPQEIQWHSLENITTDSQDDGKKNKRVEWARAFRRTTVPTYVAPGGHNGVQEFETTRKCMKTSESLASINTKGHSTNAKKRIWDVDIFARPLEENKGSEVAHLLPDAPDHAIEWYDVACWAIGEDPERTNWSTVFRLLHGTKGGDKKRVSGSGVRHFVANKVRVNDQEKVLDKEDPQLMIIPIQTREQCLRWNGEDYEAIVLVGANKDGKSQKWATKTIGLTDNANIAAVFDASTDDLQKALRLLEECTFAMVQSLVNCKQPQVPSNATEDEKKQMDDAMALLRNRRESFLAAIAAVGQKPAVPVPKRGNTGPVPSVEQPYRSICKIRFSNDTSESNYLHPAPDPILLLARATVVWSVRHKIRLRASAVAEDNPAIDEYELDAHQLEYWAKLKNAKQLEEHFQGSELAVERRHRSDSDAESEASSLSSRGSQAVVQTVSIC